MVRTDGIQNSNNFGNLSAESSSRRILLAENTDRPDKAKAADIKDSPAPEIQKRDLIKLEITSALKGREAGEKLLDSDPDKFFMRAGSAKRIADRLISLTKEETEWLKKEGILGEISKAFGTTDPLKLYETALENYNKIEKPKANITNEMMSSYKNYGELLLKNYYSSKDPSLLENAKKQIKKSLELFDGLNSTDEGIRISSALTALQSYQKLRMLNIDGKIDPNKGIPNVKEKAIEILFPKSGYSFSGVSKDTGSKIEETIKTTSDKYLRAAKATAALYICSIESRVPNRSAENTKAINALLAFSKEHILGRYYREFAQQVEKQIAIGDTYQRVLDVPESAEEAIPLLDATIKTTSDEGILVLAALKLADFYSRDEKTQPKAEAIYERLLGKSSDKQNDDIIKKIPRASEEYQIKSTEAGYANILVSQDKNLEEAKTLLTDVLNYKTDDKHLTERAGINLAKALAKSEGTQTIALEIFKALSGKPYSETVLSQVAGLGIKSISPAVNKANRLEAKLGIIKCLKDQKADKIEIETLDAEILNELCGESKKEFDIIKTMALVEYAEILRSNKMTTDAFNVFSSVLNGGNVTIPGGKVLTTSKTDIPYFINKATLGYHETLLAIPAKTPQEKRAIEDKAIEVFNQIINTNSSTGKFTDNTELAQLDLADIYSGRKADRGTAKELYKKVLSSSKDNEYNITRADLGLAMLSLSGSRKEMATNPEFAKHLDTIAAVIKSKDPDYAELKNRASVELARFLSSFDGTRPLAIKMLDRLLGTLETPTFTGSDVANALSEIDKDVHIERGLREKIFMFLLRADTGTGQKAIAVTAEAMTPITAPYLIAAAKQQRGELLLLEGDQESAAKAQEDFAGVQTLLEGAPPAVQDHAQLLKARTGAAMAEGVSAGEVSQEKLDEIETQYTQAVTPDAAGESMIERDPYLEATISLQRLQTMLDNCDPKTAAGSVQSGQIISGYKTFLRGDYTPEIRNRAILGLATAFQKFGNAEEAKKYLEILENAPDFEKEKFTDAASLQNMGVLSIGDSDPKLALKYFEEADRRDPSDPSTKIYSARAMYLTERFNTKEFMEKYNEALGLLWSSEKKGNKDIRGSMPPLEDLVKEIFEERGENFEALNKTANGRYIILTALEAEAKRWQSKGDDFKAALRYEKAVALLEAWQGTGQDPKNDYLFESQLHYDLASAYMGLNRMYDAYKEYQQIKDLGVAPGWWIEDQLRLLNPEQLSVSVNGEEDLNIAYRRAFEKGNIQLSASKDGGSAEGFFFVNKNKSLGVRVRLGAFKHGRYDAGLGVEYNKGKYKVWANTNYSRSETNEGIEKQVIGIEAGAETRLTRYLTIGMKGKVDFHYEDFDYTTWELTAYARYARKLDILGKNATFFANIEATYGKKRLEAYTYGEKPITQASEGTESGWWEWDTTYGVQHSYTINTATKKPLRERYWYVDDEAPASSKREKLYDSNGNQVFGWHISVALEPKTQIKNIANPLSSTPGDTIEIKLNDIYKMSFMSDDNSWLSAENSLVLPKGQRPSASQINGMNLDAMVKNPDKPKLCVHQEKIKTQTTVPSQSGGEFSITVEGRDRAYVKDQWNTEFGGWYDLYTIKVTKTSVMGVPTTTVSMTDHVTGETSTLYQGKQTKEAILVIEDFFRARGEVGVTKKVHLKGMDAVLEVTPSLFAGGEHVDKPKLNDNEWADTQEGPYYGANLAARLSKGADSLSGNLTFANYNEEGWDTTWSLTYNHAIGADASIRTEINPGGLQGGVGYKGVYAGIDSNGLPTVGVKIPAIRANGQQYFGEIPLGISADGVSAYGISAAAASPIGVAAGAVAKAYDANQDVKKTREEIEVITRQLKEADDPKLRALLRQKLADAYIKAGASTANWLQDSTRIPVLNLLTMLGGTREYKNSVRIEDEIKGTIESLSALEENGAFAWMAGTDGSMPASADAIRSYIGEETEYFEESNGSARKIADAQEKVVRGVLTPVRLAAKALHITNPKPKAGTVTKRSFSGMVDNKKQLWTDLLSQGYIDGEGVIQQKARNMADDEVVALDTEMYSLSERHKITTALRESLDREDRPVEERPAPPTGTAEELREAFNQKLFEDSMYLIYRLISQKGMTPQTRATIGQMLSKLPDNMRSEVEHFIDAMPTEYLDELNSGIKVAVTQPSAAEGAAGSKEKPKKVLVEAEVFSRESLKGNALSDRLALEKAAIERFESAKNMEQFSEELLAELQSAINTQNSNAIYSSAVGLFMIAGTSDNNAGMISEKIRSLDPKTIFGALDQIKDKIADFYTNRRPGSRKVFGGQKTKVKVEGFWGERSSNGQPKAIKAEFSVEEFVSAVITGRVKEETMNKNSRAVAKKDFKGMVGDVDALWTALVSRGYINQNGVIQQSFRTLQETEDRTKALEGFDMPYEKDVKENIFSVLANYKRSNKPGFVRDTSVRDIKHRARADESARAALNITPAPAELLAPLAEEKQPVPAKIDEKRAVVEMTEQDNKEAEKAARRARIKKAQESYGVGSRRSRQR